MPRKSVEFNFCPHCKQPVDNDHSQLYRTYTCGSFEALLSGQVHRTAACREIEGLRELLQWAHGQAKYAGNEVIQDRIKEFANAQES